MSTLAVVEEISLQNYWGAILNLANMGYLRCYKECVLSFGTWKAWSTESTFPTIKVKEEENQDGYFNSLICLRHTVRKKRWKLSNLGEIFFNDSATPDTSALIMRFHYITPPPYLAFADFHPFSNLKCHLENSISCQM